MFDLHMESLFNVPKKKKRSLVTARDRESSVLRGCKKTLALHPEVIYWERRTTGSFAVSNGRVSAGVPGAPDLWCVLIDGRHVEIECKRRDGKGRLSVTQKLFRDDSLKRGIPWVCVKNEKELADFINGLLDSPEA